MTFEEVIKDFSVSGLRLEAVQTYLKQGGDIHHKDSKMNWTLLHFAAEEGNCKMVQLLAHCGADLNACDNQGWTALHIAVDTDCDTSSRGAVRPDALPTVKALLKAGANELVRSRDGRTARDIACDYGEAALYDSIFRESET